MESLRSYILESKFIPDVMARALYSALPLVEATNINKDFLLKTAGSPEALATAKQSVNTAWATDEMDGIVRNQNVRQKVLNILYLMEIRKPGFTNHDVLKGIHDLAIANSLEQRFLSKVNSDTQPEQALEALGTANQAAVQAAKIYPDLTDSEEKVWNRVKVYHEFPDGFKWIYAVDANGRIAPNMPSNITHKTMRHCGNSPRAGSDDQYWELRGPDGRAYLTVILNPKGEIQESKSWGNQANKFRKQILPYVKWFLMDRKVTGVGGPHSRYNVGYSAHTNFGVKDFIGDDNEFVDYVLENKPDLIGTTERRTLFWKNAIDDGIITVDTIKSLYADGCRMGDLFRMVPAMEQYSKTSKYFVDDSYSLFGDNPFEVVCAACGGCPYTDDELKALIANGTVSLEEFANYDIKLLTPEIQKAFVMASSRSYRNNLDTLMEIASQVATFTVSDEAIFGLIAGDNPKWTKFLGYFANANPPSKVSDSVHRIFADSELMSRVEQYLNSSYNTHAICEMMTTLSNFDDIDVPDWIVKSMPHWLGDGICAWNSIINVLCKFDDARLRELTRLVSVDTINTLMTKCVSKCGYSDLSKMVKMAIRCGWSDVIEHINASDGNVPEFAISYAIETGRGVDRCKAIVLSAMKQGNFGENMSRSPDNPSWCNGDIINPPALCAALVHYPEILDSIDWVHDLPANKALCDALDNSRLVTSDEKSVDAFIGRLLQHGIDIFVTNNADVSHDIALKWLSSSVLSIVTGVIELGDRFGISAEKYSAALTAIVKGWYDCTASDTGNVPELSGQGKWIDFPMDTWPDMSAKFGRRFIAAYILDGGQNNGLSAETAWPALLDIMPNLPAKVQDDILAEISNRARMSNIPALVKELTTRVLDGRLPLSMSQMTYLMTKQLIPAKIIRQLSERGDGMTNEITTADGIRGLSNSLHKMLKVTALPEMIKSAMYTTVRELYDNMGTYTDSWGDEPRWRADKVNSVYYMCDLMANKIRCKLDKYLVAKAFLDMANDAELINRLSKFPQANRDATEGKTPTWKCYAAMHTKEFVEMLQNESLRKKAERTVAEKAPKPKAPRASRARKPKAAPPVA